MSGQNPRQIAAQVLGLRDYKTTGLQDNDTAGTPTRGGFVEDLLDQALDRACLSPPDRRLAQELVYGVVRWQATLDWLINRKMPRPPKVQVRNLLRLGLYQIFWLERIPNHAAVHETVELAKSAGFLRHAGLVNAVLRGYLREFDVTKAALSELRLGEPHLGYSHPQWLVERWRARWGSDGAARLMDWNNTPPTTYARLNTLKTDAAGLLAQWRVEGVQFEQFERHWLASELVFGLKSHPPLSELPSFRQGYFYIQDPSTLLAVRELDPRPGEAILDLCAAPGGKLSYIAQLMRNQGRLLAHDISPQRLQLIEDNCARLGITCVQTILPSPFSSLPSSSFDRILLDAPCSNTGVMRRRVELRWRFRPEEIPRLRATQLKLLRQAVPLLKSRGTLVYSTCSLEPEENRHVVNEFLESASQFKLEAEHELLPFVDGVDGVYVARLLMIQNS